MFTGIEVPPSQYFERYITLRKVYDIKEFFKIQTYP